MQQHINMQQVKSIKYLNCLQFANFAENRLAVEAEFYPKIICSGGAHLYLGRYYIWDTENSRIVAEKSLLGDDFDLVASAHFAIDILHSNFEIRAIRRNSDVLIALH